MSEPSPSKKPNTARPPDPGPKGQSLSPTGEKSGYKYLPIVCPNCGFQGKVNIARLDQTFHCKECGQVFHVTRHGAVAGERPADAPAVDDLSPPVEEEPTWLERTFAGLPPWAKWVALGAVLLVVAYLGARLLEPSEPLPRDLEARAALAAKSFAAGDWSTMKRMAKPGTARDLGAWYDANRPDEWSGLSAEQINSKIASPKKVLKRYEKQTPILNAETSVEFVASGQQSVTIPFFWDETVTEEWWLDGERMLKESKPKKGASARQEQGQERGAAEDEDSQ
ncbi:MAG TPA: hypothetical protein VFI31_16340 [Pirellulales bacterium]|nr:hypothetical protein [Pirellulales bacterium]